MSSFSEPPRPQRGATMAERGSDASEPERELAEAQSWAGKLGAAINPKFLLSQADGYPAGIKQFLQFCLILIYPAWLFMVLLAWPVWLVGKILEAILMVLFWPVRARHKRKNPEEYAAFQEELKARKGR
jgi:YggT family protein